MAARETGTTSTMVYHGPQTCHVQERGRDMSGQVAKEGARTARCCSSLPRHSLTTKPPCHAALPPAHNHEQRRAHNHNSAVQVRKFPEALPPLHSGFLDDPKIYSRICKV
jgi:hypothetical protein